MYMFTQKESQYMAQLRVARLVPGGVARRSTRWASTGPRIFVMPATDPINPNVHPLIYRWNGILGQSQAAALEAAGKDGIIYNSTYTNFWQGAMAWSGWWHNQIGLLTEVASVRVAVAGRSAARARRTASRRAEPADARRRAAPTGHQRAAAAADRHHRRAPSTRARGSAAAGRCATSSTTS